MISQTTTFISDYLQILERYPPIKIIIRLYPFHLTKACFSLWSFGMILNISCFSSLVIPMLLGWPFTGSWNPAASFTVCRPVIVASPSADLSLGWWLLHLLRLLSDSAFVCASTSLDLVIGGRDWYRLQPSKHRIPVMIHLLCSFKFRYFSICLQVQDGGCTRRLYLCW